MKVNKEEINKIIDELKKAKSILKNKKIYELKKASSLVIKNYSNINLFIFNIIENNDIYLAYINHVSEDTLNISNMVSGFIWLDSDINRLEEKVIEILKIETGMDFNIL